MVTLQKLAIFGGSFDPPTIGHLKVVQALLKQVHLDGVQWVPCGQREDKKLSSGEQRLAMSRLALRDFFGLQNHDERVQVNPIEIENGSIIPTFDLMRQMKERLVGSELFFVIGSDLVSSIHQWNEGQALLEENHFIVLNRPGSLQVQRGAEHVNLLAMKSFTLLDEEELPEVSSTLIRQRVKEAPQDPDITHMVTPSVKAYLVDH